jgi:hypothetical protein
MSGEPNAEFTGAAGAQCNDQLGVDPRRNNDD